MRVLFADDDPNRAKNLKRELDQHGCFHADFVGSSVEALEAMHGGEYAVLTTSLKDSVALVSKVKDLYPNTARMIRTNDPDVGALLRSMFVAHQMIDIDADITELVCTVTQAGDLQQLLQNQELRSIVGGVDGLPARPAIYSQLVEMLAKPDTGFREVGGLVSSDVAITAEIIRVVNTPFFSRGRAVTNVVDAVGRLGTRTVRDLVLAMEVFSAIKDKKTARLVEKIQRHCIDVGVAARAVVSRPQDRDDAFLGGLLHDVGRLVLMQTLPFAAKMTEDEDLEAERQLLGVTHAEIGAYLVGLWGLPYTVMWAVAAHHEPAVLGENKLDIAGAVFVANEVVTSTEQVSESEEVPSIAGWKTTAREALGMDQAS